MRCSHSHSAEVRPCTEVIDELMAYEMSPSASTWLPFSDPSPQGADSWLRSYNIICKCIACAGVVVRYRLLAACPPVLGALFMRNLGTITDWSGTAVSLPSEAKANKDAMC
jgi:hypothetical protein